MSEEKPHQRMAYYKGRRYILEFEGETKYGRKAKLRFLKGDDGDGFWVPSDLLQDVTADGPAPRNQMKDTPGFASTKDIIQSSPVGALLAQYQLVIQNLRQINERLGKLEALIEEAISR